MTFVFAMGSTAHAALYLWNGSAGDGLWETPANWTVTDSLWTWPNEETGGSHINGDTIVIYILNGDAVSRTGALRIKGADASTTPVLTLYSSSLTLTDRLATIGDPNIPGLRGQIDILGGSTLTLLGEGTALKIADDDNTWGTLNIVDSTVDIADNLDIDQGEGYINISGDSTVNLGDDMKIGDGARGKGYLNVSGNAVLNCGDDLVTDDGEGHITITDNAIVNVDDLVIVENDNGIGSLEVSGNATVNCDDFKIVDDPNGTGSLLVSGNAIITCDDFYGNDDSGEPSSSTVTLDGGTVIVGDDTTFNDDNPGTATITINSGSWLGNDRINVSDNLDSTVHVTINGGQMICNALRLGEGGGDDIGQIRINLNGGMLQADSLSINIADTKIIYTGGVLRIGSASLNEADMQQMITDGTIVADGAYSIVTAGDYTALNPQLLTQAKLPNPADGAEGILLGTTLSWVPGDTAATHDVYFGASSPPAFIGNQEGTTYYQLIEVGTTYYWRIDEVEADGTTVHTGDVWSFTTTTDLSTVSEIATQPDPADGAVAVALDATLSWWPGASAVSHDVYFGTTSPPALIGNQAALSFDPGPLEAGTSYYWQVDAVEADGVTVHTGNVWSFTTRTPPPPEWTCLDIGTTGGAASYEPTTGTWTIIADGHDIWGGGDGFHYCYQQPTLTRGDCTLIANVVSFPVPPGGDNWQKAGLMIRETLDAGSKNAFVAITGGSGDGSTFQWRTDTDVDSESNRTLVVPPPPASIKLVREGDTFTGYVLLDGQWQQQGVSTTVAMADPVYVGLAMTSHKAGILATVVINDVSITTPNPNIAWGPGPADGATEVVKTTTLSWGPGATAASHDVYFGDSSPPAFIGNQTGTSYDPGTLEKGKTYYWQIDEVEADGTTKHTGAVWSFTVTSAGR